MKRIFISGFRWSGSSALEELIQENFDIYPIAGDELIFFSKGVMPILYHDSFNFLERTMAPFFLDPFNNFGLISPQKFRVIKILIWIVSFRKRWVIDYQFIYSTWFGPEYRQNITLRRLIERVYFLLRNPTPYVAECEAVCLLNYLIDVVLENSGEEAILLNNCIPARFSKLLRRVDEHQDSLVICVKRDPEDQAREIKKSSFFGPVIPQKFIFKNLKGQYSRFDDDNDLLASFEDIVLDDNKRTKLLDRVAVFLGKKPNGLYRTSAIKNSHLNISKRAKFL